MSFMPFKKRQRFDRIDVREPGPHAKLFAIVALVVIFALLGALFLNLWKKANETARLGDKGLRSSLTAQSVTDPADGYVAAKGVITNVLILVVDNAKSDDPLLKEVQILSLNATTRTGSLVNLPLDTKVVVDGSATTVVQLFDGSGAAACVVPISTSTNVKLKHVIVATDALFDQFKAFRGAGVASLVDSSSELLENIGTNMGASDLMDVAELVQSIGIGNIPHSQTASTTEDDGAGGTYSVVDKVQLGLFLGTIVAAS